MTTQQANREWVLMAVWGVRAIKENAGLVLAQTPIWAKFDSSRIALLTQG